MTAEAVAGNFESKVIRKLQWRLIPLLFLLYVVSFIDRVNIGFAALSMNKDLRISSEQFGLVAGVFFFGYILSGIPSNLMLHKIGARVWIPAILVIWGFLALMTGLAHSVQQLYLMRFLLGVAEGGYFPGVVLYLTYWFRQREQAQCIAMFLTGIPASNIIGAPLSGWILGHVHWMSWPSWRWLLILEAAPALVLGIATYFVLPSRPAEAKFLDGEERDWVQAELQREESKKREAKLIGTLQALRILRVWHVGIIVFATNCAMYMLTFWMPQLVKSFSGRLSNTAIGFLVMIPYLAGLAGMVLCREAQTGIWNGSFMRPFPQHARELRWLCWVRGTRWRSPIALLAVAVAGICSVYGLAFSLPSESLAGSAVAAGLGLASSISNAAGFVGPYAAGWISQRTGSLYGGLAAAGISLFVSATLALLLPARGQGNQVTFKS